MCRRLGQVAKRHAFALTYRGKALALLEPVLERTVSVDDPIYDLADLASDKLQPLTNTPIESPCFSDALSAARVPAVSNCCTTSLSHELASHRSCIF